MHGRIFTWKLILTTVAILLPIWVLCAIGYHQIQRSYKQDLAQSLQAVVTTSQQTLYSWRDEQFHALDLMRSNPELVKVTRQLIATPRFGDNLAGHPAQARLRELIQPLIAAHEYQGYLLTAPDGTNLAASVSFGIGQQHLLQPRGRGLEPAWNGQFFISAPQPAVLAKNLVPSSTMYVGAPVVDADQRVLAVLTLQIDPSKQFFRIFRQARIGLSGETYAISHTGEQLSELRFDDALSEQALGAFQVHSFVPGLLRQLAANRQAALQNPELPQEVHINLEPYPDYRGTPVVGAWLWDSNFGMGLITEIDEDQAFGTLHQIRTVLLLSLLLTTLLFLLVALIVQWMQQRIRRRQREFKRLFENAGDPLLVADPYTLRLIACNSKACQTLGYSHEQLLKLQLKDLGEEYFPGELEQRIQLLLRSGSSVFEAQYLHQNGSTVPVEVNCQVIEHQERTALLISLRDISHRKAMEAQLKAQAQTDLLTQLPNRIAFDEQIPLQMKQQAAEQGQLALIFIGLDEVSIINDTLGHMIGDQVLIKAAQRISETIPAGACLYRFEGDVFVCSLRLGGQGTPDTMINNLTRAFIQPLSVHGRLLHLTVSIGVARHPEDAGKLVELVRCAHSAMHAAKGLGGSRWVAYTQEMQATYQLHLDIKNALGNALRQGEFSLHYQPIVDAKTGLIVGAESLLRWQHPDLGMVRPDQFIPIAENSGHIIEIGAWIIDEACATIAELRAQGHTDLRISINLSPVQLLAADILGTVRNAIGRYGLPASALAIEITEGLFIEDTTAALGTLMALHDQQIALYMDDFGTGYSSLSYLTRFPFHTLKLDRSFVTHLEQRSKDRHLASSIIAMSEKLGLRVIAEGVETPWQQQFLEQNGCHLFQGYLFYKPMDKQTLLECLKIQRQQSARGKPLNLFKTANRPVAQVSK